MADIKNKKLPYYFLASTIIFGILFSVFESLIGEHGILPSAHFGGGNFGANLEFIKSTLNSITAFRITFITDYLFAISMFLLLFTASRYIFGFKNLVYSILLGTALIIDLVENSIYLFELRGIAEEYLDIIASLKLAAHGLNLVIFLYLYFRYLLDDPTRNEEFKLVRKNLVRFLNYGWVSVLIILIILLLMTLMPQGITLVVDLFFSWINLAFVFIFLFFISIALSHYPSYMEAFYAPDQKNISWCIHPAFGVSPKLFGLGWITFEYNNKKVTENIAPKVVLFNNLRHYIGLFLISIFIYLVLFSAQQSKLGSIFNPNLAFLSFGISIWAYHRFKKDFSDTKYFKRALVFTVLIVAFGLILISLFKWSFTGVVIGLIMLLAVKVLYIFFRICRAKIFGHEKNFIAFMSIGGVISILPLIYGNLCVESASTWMSPILILILVLLNFYGIVMILFKHLFFYLDHEDDVCDDEDAKATYLRFRFYKSLIPTLVIVILILFVASPNIKNSLHTIQGGKLDWDNQSTIKAYEDHILALSEDSGNVIFQVASYGGGLKADLWTLLVLNSIQEETGGEFIYNVTSMSGTSGGMIGLGNYAQLWASNLPGKSKIQAVNQIKDRIIDVGIFKHLTIDITYLLGRDLIREFLPGYKRGTDRSYMAMKEYARLSGMADIENHFNMPYHQYFGEKIFTPSGYYPPLIVNTFATSGKQGSGLSMDLDVDFPNTIDIADTFEEEQISYYGALSTSNRFPLFSPTANVRSKGHFLDGGYFDNSGLALTTSFRDSYLKKKGIEKTKIVIINNAKSDYIRYLFRPLIEKYGLEENTQGEISAILTGVSGTDKVPNYFEGMVNDDAIRIFLPHPISYSDLVAAYDGVPRIPPDTLFHVLDSNNRMIKEILEKDSLYEYQWGVVQPPLARLNSKPAVQFQVAMINQHSLVTQAIDTIAGIVND